MSSTTPRYRIVLDRPAGAARWKLGLAVVWLLSLLLVAWLTQRFALPAAVSTQEGVQESAGTRRGKRDEVEQLRRRVAVLEHSDRISRAANRDLQDTLTQRETQISGLRSDVAFYARLVGPTAGRMDLGPFSSRFMARRAGVFDYTIVLTQTLNRGAISTGSMEFAVEGTRGGQRQLLDWAALHAGKAPPQQAFSFRYFQELQGSIVLPQDFIPQRVHVSLLVPGREPIRRDFDWSLDDQ